MRVSLRWLSEFIEVGVTPEALAEQLTVSGLEADFLERAGQELGDVRVGFVTECGRHPNADRLSVCRVDLGGEEPVEIVCGAPNVAAGQKVAVASPGARLPGDLKIKKSKIRGVTSLGMICSERELGLSPEHEGILVLPEDAPVGAPVDAGAHDLQTVRTERPEGGSTSGTGLLPAPRCPVL
ncbi:MAG: hypothetical protein MJE66_17550, partial [Proteobacteria bacterium]|nr:hypothetical protein [Pseudomonadota bacterium]